MINLIREESVFKEEKSMVYFWRVVVLRSLRELYLLRNGKYDKSFEMFEKNGSGRLALKEKIVDSVLSTLIEGVNELNLI